MNILIVDMIEGFTRSGPLASSRIEALLPKQVDFLSHISPDSFVALVYDSHTNNTEEFRRFPVHCLKDSHQSKICFELLECLSKRHIQFILKSKNHHGLPSEIDLAGDDWVVIGCVTDICIMACTFDLLKMGKNVTIVKDLIDTYEAPEHNPILINSLYFSEIYPSLGCKVITANQVQEV